MENPIFKLLLPKPNAFGNLLWSYPKGKKQAEEFHALFERIKATGIWCSCYPEGDGFCFATDSDGRIDESLLTQEYYKQTIQLFKEVFGERLLVNPLTLKIVVYAT